MKKILLLIWRLLYPILIYLFITTIVSITTLITVAVGILYSLNTQDGAGLTDLLTWANEHLLLLTFISALITIPILFLFFRRDQKRDGFIFSEYCALPKTPVSIILLGIICCLGGNALLSLLQLDKLFPSYSALSQALFATPMLLQIAATGIAVPLVEELIFRGLGFRRLRGHCGFWLSAIISSFMFAVMHGNVVQGIYGFLLGIMMCYIYEEEDTLLAPWLFHTVANLLSVLISNVVVLNTLTEKIYVQLGALAVAILFIIIDVTRRRRRI